MLLVQKFLQYLLLSPLFKLRVVAVLETNVDAEIGRGFMGAILGTMKNIPTYCSAVLLFDDTLPSVVMDRLLQGIHHQDRVALTLELSSEQFDKFGTTENTTAEIVEIYLTRLYRQGRCYAFVVWVKDPTILYSISSSHPGWRKQDYVLIPLHESLSFTYYREIIGLKIWNVIPNMVGLRKTEIKPTRIPVFTVHPNYRNGARRVEELDVWKVKDRQFERNSTLFKEKFAKFNGGVIDFGWIWKIPFFILGDKENPYLDGLDWRLSILAHQKLDYIRSAKQVTGRVGTKLENGSWTGLMGYLMNGDIDIIIGGIIITPGGLEDFDYCTTYFTDSYTFISPLELSRPSVWDAITKPLSLQVWIATGIAAVFATICMKFLAMTERKLRIQYHDNSNFTDQHFTQIAVNIGFLFCAFCQKPTYYVPKSAPLKFAYAGISFSLIILGIVFGARMFSIILIKGPDTSINRIEDLENLGLQIDMKDSEEYLSEYLEATRPSLFKKINQISQLLTLDSIDEVVKGNRIFIDARSSLDFTRRYYYKAGKGYKFHLSSEHLLRGNIGWAVRKNWPYREAMDRIIKSAVESGLVHHWMSHFRRGSFGWDDEALKINIDNPYLTDRVIRVDEFDPTMDSDHKEFKLLLDNFFGIGMIWIVGMSISGIVFIGELISCWTSTVKSLTKIWHDRNERTFLKQENKVLEDQLHRTLRKGASKIPVIMWTDFTTTRAFNRKDKSLSKN